MEEYNDFMKQLFTQLSMGNKIVSVINNEYKSFPADVIGYSEEYMTIKVRYHSNDLTIPKSVEVKSCGWGYDLEDDVRYEVKQVPIKEMDVYWSAIKLTH